MSSTLAHISCEKINGERVFLVRMYNAEEEIGAKTPSDIWECFRVMVDDDTLNYLITAREDEREWERAVQRVKPLERNEQVHPIFRDIINKL